MLIAMITGITGQDGSYLTELLLEKGYEVHGLVRRSSSLSRPRLDAISDAGEGRHERLHLHYADLSDATTIRRIVERVQPNEFYHLAGQSHVGLSFEIPESTCESTAMATLRIMEILRVMENPPKFLHASSREIFGSPVECPQDERTPMNPNSPYGCAKAFATQMTRVYRESHGLFFTNAICFNHESPRRGENFVTRKISLAVAKIHRRMQSILSMGNLDAARDWGYAGDYVNAMWLMLQQPKPDDFVVSSGESHTIREFMDIAFAHVGENWQDHVVIDPRFQRPTDVENLMGNSTKARQLLGWQPSVDFQGLVQMMVDADLNRLASAG